MSESDGNNQSPRDSNRCQNLMAIINPHIEVGELFIFVADPKNRYSKEAERDNLDIYDVFNNINLVIEGLVKQPSEL